MHQNLIFHADFFLEGISTGRGYAKVDLRPQRFAQSSVRVPLPHDAFRKNLWCGRFGRLNSFFRLRFLLFKLEANFPVLQFQISGEGTSLF